MNLRPPTANWTVIKLLWKAARQRTKGRQKRQQDLMHRRKGSSTNAMGALGMVMVILLMAFIHGVLGFLVVEPSFDHKNEVSDIRNRLVIPDDVASSLEWFKSYEKNLADADSSWSPPASDTAAYEKLRGEFIDYVGYWRCEKLGLSYDSDRILITRHFHRYGSKGFILQKNALGISGGTLENNHGTLWIFPGFIIIWWFVMMVCQGEGLELDMQRRRHPMWEWVQSHPVRPVAAFAADQLAPMIANPVYATAPIFWWIVLTSKFGVLPGLLGGSIVGLAFAVSASCLNKALEISAMLRLPPRSRGAALGLMSWLGYVAFTLPLFSFAVPTLKETSIKLLAPLDGWLPLWPVRALLVGWGEKPMIWQVVISGVTFSVLMMAGAVSLAWWAANQGLQASSGASSPGPVRGSGPRLLSSQPLYRKELLWFWRDKGAVVQAVLIPLTMASFQLFNFRSLMAKAVGSWNGICGAAVLCGTYFLLVLGPRSLTSEGGALWLATTWPQGMESLLKAKARLWWLLSSAIVGLVMLVGLCMFPAEWWRISLAVVGWFFFGRSLSEKMVTLANAPSSSGEPEPIPQGRRWAAMLGTFTFAIGIMTGVWSVAVTGVVFSALTGAAMWQNFRARLPFLFDPWSEKLPPAPTLMHAMIGIIAMIEVIGIATAVAVAIGGMETIWLVRAISYGVVGVIAWISMSVFLENRGVKAAEIWSWGPVGSITRAYAGAALVGILLGGLALLYLQGLRILPLTHGWIAEMDKAVAGGIGQKVWMMVLAVGVAPFAEEYFFRGLLYRALDREWGGWPAVLGSAAYFGIYHPPISWLPVMALGVCSALLFKKSGRLGPCVFLHMVYNAVVTGV